MKDADGRTPPIFRGDVQQWAAELHEYLSSANRADVFQAPTPVLLSHLVGDDGAKPVTDGILMYDGVWNQPVYALDGEWVPLGTGKRYETVPDLLASLETNRGVGVEWFADGFRYTEADPSATDYGVITAGGVKLYPEPQGSSLHIEQFGLQTNVDQTAELKAAILYAAVRDYPLEFDGKLYEFTEIKISVSDILAAGGGVRANFEIVGANLKSTKAVRTGTDPLDDWAIFFEETIISTGVTLAADANVGDISIQLSSTSGVIPGDLLRLRASRLIPTDHRGGWTEGQLVKVDRIEAGNVAVLAHPIMCYMPANRTTTGTITARIDDYNLELSNMPPDNSLRSIRRRLRITSGSAAGEERYIVGYTVGGTNSQVRHAGGQPDEVNRGVWPAGVQVGDAYSFEWKVDIEHYRPSNVVFRDCYIYRDKVTNASAGDRSFRGICFFGQEVRIENCKVENFPEMNIDFRWCYKPLVRDTEVNNANRSYNFFDGTGYGVSIVVCFGAYLDNVRGRSNRRVADNSGSEGYCMLSNFVNCVAIGGGQTYEGLDFFPNTVGGTWPGGVLRNFGFGSHGSAFRCTYHNCRAIDIYGGLTLRGQRETVKDFEHSGYCYFVSSIFGSGAGYMIDGLNYDDRFSEPDNGPAERFNIGGQVGRRAHIVVEIEGYDGYPDSTEYTWQLPLTIQNCIANSIVQAFVLIRGPTNMSVRNMIIRNNYATVSNEGTSGDPNPPEDFRFIFPTNNFRLRDSDFHGNNFRLVQGDLSQYAGSAVFTTMTDTSGLNANSRFIMENGTYTYIDDWVYAQVGQGDILRIPVKMIKPMLALDLMTTRQTIRSGANRPRYWGGLLTDSSATDTNTASFVLNCELLSSDPTDATVDVTSGNVGIFYGADEGYLALANNLGTSLTFMLRMS